MTGAVLVIMGILALIQEAVTGLGLAAAGITAAALVLPAQPVMGLAFIAGLMADLIGDRVLGISSLVYLAAAMGGVMFSQRLPKRRVGLTSMLAGGIIVIERWLFQGRVGWGQIAGGLIMFWVLLVLFERIADWKKDARQLRLGGD